MSDGLSDDDLRALAESPIARLALACRDVVMAADEIQENDLVWQQLITETERRSSRISSKESAEDVMRAFLDSLEHYGALATPRDEADGEAELEAFADE